MADSNRCEAHQNLRQFLRPDRLDVLVRPAAELLIGVVVFAFAYSFLVPLLRSANAVFGGNLVAP